VCDLTLLKNEFEMSGDFYTCRLWVCPDERRLLEEFAKAVNELKIDKKGS